MELFTSNQVEVAQCFWEAYLESPESFPMFQKIQEEQGTAYLRLLLRGHALVCACETLWESFSPEIQERFVPFDWLFIPWFLKNCIIPADGREYFKPIPEEQMQEKVTSFLQR